MGGRPARLAAAVQAHVDAFNGRDLGRLLDGFTEYATWVTGQSSFRGRAELRQLFNEAFTGLAPTLTIDALLVDGERAACQLRERLVHDGQEATFFIAAFYMFRDTRIASAKIYREGSAEL